MDLRIERDLLVEGLQRVIGAVEARATVPVLSNVRIEAAARALLITGTDQDVEVTLPIIAEVTRQGVTTANARLLFELAKKMPKGGQLALSCGDGDVNLRIVSGKSKYMLCTIPADDFPSCAYMGDAVSFQWDSGALRRMIEAARFAVSADASRYYLNGIYLHVDGEELVACATNGHQLSTKSEPLPAGAAPMPGVIIPTKTLSVLDKFLPTIEREIGVEVAKNAIRVTLGEARLASKLIDGAYPDYKRVIPTAHAGTAIVPRRELLAAVEMVGVVLGDKAHAVQLEFGGDSLRVRAVGVERGTGECEVADCIYDGEPVMVGASFHYLTDELSATDSNQVSIRLCAGSPAGGPMLLEEVDRDGSHRMVLMPMRV
jgi:DNA polymerase-3 subunit beta